MQQQSSFFSLRLGQEAPRLSLGFSLSLTLAVILGACGGDDGNANTTSTETGDGDGDPSTGDGDPSTGDGDPSTGDGDPSTGDGDPSTGDGDGDPACASTWETTTMQVNGRTHAAYAVDVAANGNFVAAGKFEQANNDDDAWVGLFDPTGALVWEQTIDGGNGSDAAVGVTFDAGGDVVLIGRQAGTNNQDLWIEKRGAAAGAVVWSVVEVSQFDGDNEPGDIGLAPDGTLVVTGALRTGDKDLDVWVRKLDSSDGAEVWARTYSGSPDANGLSIDRGSELGISPDGSIYVGGSEGVDFETREAVVLRFASDGTQEWAVQPRANGLAHLQNVSAVSAGPDGEGYIASYQTNGVGGLWLNRISTAGDLEWELTEDDLVFGATKDFVIAGLDLADDGSLTVGGRLTNEEVGQGISWSEAWIANIGLDGVGQCIASHTWKNTHIIPARTLGYGLAEGPNGAVVVGEVLDGPENYLWLGGFL